MMTMFKEKHFFGRESKINKCINTFDDKCKKKSSVSIKEKLTPHRTQGFQCRVTKRAETRDE